MNKFVKGSVLLLLFMITTVGTGANAVRRNRKTEQERIKSYQARLQNFIRSKVEDGEMSERTEPLQCYSCRNAKSNEECNRGGMVTCSPTQTACQTEIKVSSPKHQVNVRIKKGCKHERVCGKNFNKNDKTAWLSPQCNRIPQTPLSVCRRCCKDSGCNEALPDHVCGEVPAPEFGSVTCKQNDMNSLVCTFECEPCHRLTGSKVRMCLNNALWSGNDTKCTYDDSLPGCQSSASCPSDVVRPPANGIVECSNETNPGSECRFVCQRGFFLAGKRVLRCRKRDFKWDADRPTCIRGDDTGNPCNVFASFEYTPDGKLTCDCNTGFTGDGFLSCDDVNECAENLHVCDEHADCTNIIGSYRCQCRPGYQGNGFECGDINECSSEGDNNCDPVNGICINADGSYTCACKPGFIGDGRTCKRGEAKCPGVFDGDVCLTGSPSGALRDEEMYKRTVIEETTTTTENPVQSTTSQSTTKTDQPVYTCVKVTEDKPAVIKDLKEYQLLNDRLLRKIVQTSNNTEIVYGPWIGLDDRIQPGVLRWRDGKKLEESDFQMWAPGQPKMLDNDGFGNCVDMVSDPVRSHTTSFMWQITLCSQPTRFVCESEQLFGAESSLCLPLVEIANGQVFCDDSWNVGSVCTFSCNRGFVMRGSSILTCDPDTVEWDKEPPICVRTVCTQPLMPPNSGIMECTNENKEGSVCTFTCKPGYDLHGNSTVTCGRNLKWDSQRPCCRDDCPPLARMNLILVLDSSRSINSSNFELIKQFAQALHRRFEISEDFTQVSVITYHREINLLNDVKVYTSSDELDIALDELPYQGAGTYIGKAINYVTDNLIGLRPGTGDVVVILTDGISHDDVYIPSRHLQEAGAHVIAVGVHHAWRYQLNLIASEPSDVNVVQVETYTDLSQIVNIIGQKVCHFSC